MRSLTLTCLLGLAASGVLAQQQGGTPTAFPDLEFAGADGGSVKLSDLKGNVILLNVWATWCGPCREELPIVQRMYDKYSDRNFVVLAVNVDAERKRVEPFLKRYNLSLPIYYAAPEDAAQMTAMGIPSTFILAPDRSLLDRSVGYHPAVEERWKGIVEKHLKPSKKTAAR
jgi:thiol-disulfide isomerase/thioredoxin